MKGVIYIIDNLCIAGAQRHLLRLADGLTKDGCSIEIVSLGISDENLIKEIKVPLSTFKIDCVWQLRFWLGFFRLIIFLSKKRPSIVHTYLNTSNVFGVLAAKLSGVPLVISSRRDLGQFRSGIIGLLERFTASLSDRVVCVSEAVRKNCVEKEKIPLAKTEVIYNGVGFSHDLSAMIYDLNTIGLSSDDLVVGMIATMDRKEKGHKEFIEAAALVLKEIPNAKFLLIGDGFLRKSYELRAMSSGYKDRIIFLGKRSDIPELLSIMDVSVNASYSEGMSNTILESMATGVPVVATAVDGNLETVKSLQFDYTPACRQAGITKLDYTDENHATGILVPPKNPQAMAEAIIRILKDKDLAVRMGQNARKLVKEKFSLERMVQNYCSIYNELISSKNLSFASIKNLPAKDPEHSEGRQSALNKIGYVVSLFPCWSETFILNELIELKKRCFDITIFSIRKDLEKFTQEKAKQFINNTKYPDNSNIIKSFIIWSIRKPLTLLSIFWMVVSKRYPSLKALVKNIWCIFIGCYFSSIAKKEHLTHIHAHFATYPTLVALVISKLTKIPYTFTVHAHDIFLDKTLLKEKAKATKAIIAISDYNKRYVSDYCQNGIAPKIKVIHCGLDLSEFANLNGKHTENLILSIGRLTKMKGFEYLIKACSQIKNRMPVQCRIIGDGPLRDELERLIINLGLRDCVRLEGVMDSNKIKQLLQNTSAFVLPSVWDKQDGQDGIPMVLMEAMAARVPVIASNISGIPELVEDGKAGLLAEPGNVEQLSQKILQLLTDKELQSRLAEAGRRRVEEEFGVVKSVDKLVEIFNT